MPPFGRSMQALLFDLDFVNQQPANTWLRNAVFIITELKPVLLVHDVDKDNNTPQFK